MYLDALVHDEMRREKSGQPWWDGWLVAFGEIEQLVEAHLFHVNKALGPLEEGKMVESMTGKVAVRVGHSSG